ncbi:MAG: molybdenum cofactor guanylyltransferase [Halanaeroarchaeum sp.]
MRSAVILAGGFGTRFDGGEKALARIGGRPMIRHVAAGVADAVDEVVVNAREEQVSAFESALGDLHVPVRFAVDVETDRGPLAGMWRGLAAAGGTHSLVIACDMPFVVTAFVERLFAAVGDADAAIPLESADTASHLQPLQAVYRTESMESAAKRSLESAIGSPRTAVESLSYVTVVPGDVETSDCERAGVAESHRTPGDDCGRTLWNVNTVSDLREARRSLSGNDSPIDPAEGRDG